MAFPLIAIPAIIEAGKMILDRVIPDKAAAGRAKMELELLATTREFQSQLGQIQINVEEAKSPNWFVAGWRPWIGWVCGFAFAYTYIVLPIMLYLTYTFGSLETVKQVSGLPQLEISMMLGVLGGMLGLGGMRTYEKKTDSEDNR